MQCCTSPGPWDKKFQSWKECLPELYQLDDIKTRDIKQNFTQTVVSISLKLTENYLTIVLIGNITTTLFTNG